MKKTLLTILFTIILSTSVLAVPGIPHQFFGSVTVNGGIASDYEVTMFLVSSGVDWVRKKAMDVARMNPLDPPVKDMIQNVMDSGGNIMVCPPCAQVRGYDKEDFIDGVQLAGSTAMLGVVSEGASTLTF